MDWWAKVRHSLHFGGVKAVEGAEAIGEVSGRACADLTRRHLGCLWRALASVNISTDAYRPHDWHMPLAARFYIKTSRGGVGSTPAPVSRRLGGIEKPRTAWAEACALL